MKKTMIGPFYLAMCLTGFFFFLAGCAADKNPPFGAAEFVSSPPGADVKNVLDDSTLGTTPFTYVRETEEGEQEYMTVRFVKPGYKEETVSFFLNPGYEDEEKATENPQQIEINLVQEQ